MRVRAAFILPLALAGCGARTAMPGPERSDGALRIMSMNPCIDAVLVQVADPGQIVSISHYSHDPASTSMPVEQARRFAANYDTAEEAIALRPSVVLLSPHVAQATQAAIRASGVTVASFGVPATIDESLDQIRAIARVAGHPERGVALAARVAAALAQARPEPGMPPVRALIRTSSGLVPGSGTLADELLARTGFRNMSSAYGLAMWDILPLEPLLAQPPELLLTSLHGGRGQPGPLLAKAGVRMADFPERLLQCAGPSLIEAAARLRSIRRDFAGSQAGLRRAAAIARASS